jgi:hypothetical protein
VSPIDTNTNPTDTGITLEESIAQGRTAVETVEFTEADKTRINDLAVNVPEDIRNKFEELYTDWEKTLSAPYLKEHPELAMQSNPEFWMRLDEYKQLIGFCQEQGKLIWPLFYRKVLESDNQGALIGLKGYMLGAMLWNLTIDKYSIIWDQVRADYYRYNEKGQYIIPGNGTIMKKFIKVMLLDD